MDRITFRAVIVLLLGLPLSVSAAGEHRHAALTALSPFARKLLGADDSDLKRLSLSASQGLIELAPINLPINPKGDNDHFGWPVATVLDDTLIVVHRAMPGHNRKLSGDADADTTYSTIVHSNDGGQLEDCDPLRDDSINQAATWNSGADISKLAGQPIRLRFELKDAELYSFQFATRK